MNNAMKKLTLILSFFFTLSISTPSFAAWEKVGESWDGDPFLVDFKQMRSGKGFLYFWLLVDRLEPSSTGTWSSSAYTKLDCKLQRYQRLILAFYSEPMGKGVESKRSFDSPEWKYLKDLRGVQNSKGEGSPIIGVIKSICNRMKTR